MTGVICERFLRWFDNKMRGRKVILLLDNVSGHELGVQEKKKAVLTGDILKAKKST
jgi:hypothetical protein